jgi:hypothetical protein
MPKTKDIGNCLQLFSSDLHERFDEKEARRRAGAEGRMLDHFAPIKDRIILNGIQRERLDSSNLSMFGWNLNKYRIGPNRKEVAKMKTARNPEETREAEEKTEKETCDPEVLGDPVQCIVAWDNRMSEELRKIRPILEPLMRMQYPNPFTKWVEAFRKEAENFNRNGGMKAA